MFPLLYLMVGMSSASQSGRCDFVSYEHSLRHNLLSTYDVEVRPLATTDVFLTFILNSINKVDIATQSMTISGYMIATWTDHRLTWNKTDNGNLSYLVLSSDRIWTPTIVIDNAIDNLGILGSQSLGGKSYARFDSKGHTSWTVPLLVTTSCEMTISRFPFDTQECGVKVTSSIFPLSEMSLTSSRMFINQPISNGEFDLTATRQNEVDLLAPEVDYKMNAYRQVYFYLKLRRRWPFYGQNLLMPIVLTSILMGAVFALPIESGEKMGYSLTVLLTYIVFLTWVTESLPPVSNDVSLLQVYLATVLCVGVCATLLTTWVLRLYHKPAHKPIPRILRRFVKSVLQPACRLAWRKRIPSRKTAPENTDIAFVIPVRQTDYADKGVERLGGEGDEAGHNKKPFRGDVLAPVPGDEKDMGGADSGLTWQEVATTLDSFFLMIFATFLFATTTSLILILYVDY